MKRFIRLMLAITAAILLSCFLAPIFYSFMPYFKFEKILNRLLMISALIVFFTFIKIDSHLLSAIGWRDRKIWHVEWITGFLISSVVLLMLIGTEYQLGALTFSDTYQFGAKLLLSAFLTCLAVGCIEEFFFRGYVYTNFNRVIKGSTFALILTNLLYSFVHFLKSGRPFVDTTPTMWDSFRVLGASFHAFLAWQEYWPSFIGLFLFGLVLSIAFIRTKRLFLSIGLHSGAVFFLKVTSKWYVVNPSHSELLYGGRGFYSGLIGWFFIGLIGVLTIFAANWLTSRPK